MRLARIRQEPAYCDRNHQRPTAGHLGKWDAESEGQRSCLGSRRAGPRKASKLQVPSRTKACKAGTIEEDGRLLCVPTVYICGLDGTIGAFPGAKLWQQMRLDSISAAARVVGLQGRAKTFSNAWLIGCWELNLSTRLAAAMVDDAGEQWTDLDELLHAALDGRVSVHSSLRRPLLRPSSPAGRSIHPSIHPPTHRLAAASSHDPEWWPSKF